MNNFNELDAAFDVVVKRVEVLIVLTVLVVPVVVDVELVVLVVDV